jgi:hypothetical protein
MPLARFEINMIVAIWPCALASTGGSSLKCRPAPRRTGYAHAEQPGSHLPKGRCFTLQPVDLETDAVAEAH